MRSRFVSALIVLLCGSAFSHAAAGDNPRVRIKVFCFAEANASGFVDARSQARMDSLRDLQENIQKIDINKVTTPLIVENLTNLSRLPAGQVVRCAFVPLKLAAGDGSPVRAYAWTV